MTYTIIVSRENVTISEKMLHEYANIITPYDQFAEVRSGKTISTYGFLYEGWQRGQLTVYHDDGRAAICLGGDSDWGEWDNDEHALRLDGFDDTHVWYVRDGKIWETADTESEEG
jgi:hypothetical protein